MNMFFSLLGIGKGNGMSAEKKVRPTPLSLLELNSIANRINVDLRGASVRPSEQRGFVYTLASIRSIILKAGMNSGGLDSTHLRQVADSFARINESMGNKYNWDNFVDAILAQK